MKTFFKNKKMFCGLAVMAMIGSAYGADVEKSLTDIVRDMKNPRVSPKALAQKAESIKKEMAKESGTVQAKANTVLAEVYFYLGDYTTAKECFQKGEKSGNSYRRLQMMLGPVLPEVDGRPMLEDFFRTVSKPLVAGEEEAELFERAARRQIEFLLPDKINEVKRIQNMIVELSAGDKDAYEAAKRQQVIELARIRNDNYEQNKREGKPVDQNLLEELKKEVEPLRNIVDGPLTSMYVEILRCATMFGDQKTFDDYMKSAIYYAFEFNYNMENEAASVVRANHKGTELTKKQRIQYEKDLLSEFSPYGGLYFYYAINCQQKADAALKAGNKAEAERLYFEALKSLMVVNDSYLLSQYNDKGMKLFEDITRVLDEKLGKKVKYEYKVKDYYVSLLGEIQTYIKRKDYKAMEPLILRAMRRSRGNTESVMRMAELLIRLCWANLPNREYHMIALAVGLNESYPGYKGDKEQNIVSPEELLSDVINLLLKNVTLQTQETLKFASLALETYVQIATDQEQALMNSLRVADKSYNTAFMKKTRAAKEKSAVLEQQSRDDFAVAAATYEAVIRRWPEEDAVAGAYYRAAYSYQNAGRALDATRYFMEYAKREKDPAKAQERINSLMSAGTVLLKSREKGAGAQCRDVYKLLYEIASKPSPGIEPAKAQENKELATLFMAYGHEAAGNEAQRSYEDSRIRVKEIDGEVLQLKGTAVSAKTGMHNFEKKKSEVTEELAERKVFFTGDFETSLKEMLDRLRLAEMNGAETVSAETEAKINAKLADAERRYRAEYERSRKSEVKLIRRDWEEELNELQHLVIGQRGIVSGLKEERRLTSGSLDEEIVKRDAMEKRIASEDKEIKAIQKELDGYVKELDALNKEREEILAAGKSVGDINARIGDQENQINEFRRQTASILNPKRLERLEGLKAQVAQLSTSISAGESAILPLVKKLNLESAELDYMELRIKMLSESIAYTRTAEQRNAHDPMLVRKAKEIAEMIDTLSDKAVTWLDLEVTALKEQEADCLAKEQALLKEKETIIASYAKAQEIEQVEKKQALVWFENYLRLNPVEKKHLPGALAKAAFMSVETKDYAKVEGYLARLVKEFPDSELARQAQFTLGRSYAEQGKISEAAVAFKKVVNEEGQKLPMSQLAYMVDALAKSEVAEAALLSKLDILDEITKVALTKAGEKNGEYICQTALMACIETAYQANETTRSIEYAEKLLNTYKRGHITVEAQDYLIKCYKKLGKKEEIQMTYEDLLNNRYLDGKERINYRLEYAQYCEKENTKESLMTALNNYEIIRLAWLPVEDLSGEALQIRMELDDSYEYAWDRYVKLLARFGRVEDAKKEAEEYKRCYPKGKYLAVIDNIPDPDPALMEEEMTEEE